MVRPLLLWVALVATPSLGDASTSYQSAPHVAPPKPQQVDARLASYRRNAVSFLATDFGQKYVYALRNATLPGASADSGRVVFLGDSITDKWNLATSFPGQPYINRGISGQTTPQMLVRFYQDVVSLKPRAVVVLGGVNDVAGVVQAETPQQIEENYAAMADIAEANGITPIFAKILPVNARDQARDAPTGLDRSMIAAINVWLDRFCQRRSLTLVDYGPVLRGGDGQLDPDYSIDGLHPNAKGYARMVPILAAALKRTLAR